VQTFSHGARKPALTIYQRQLQNAFRRLKFSGENPKGNCPGLIFHQNPPKFSASSREATSPREWTIRECLPPKSSDTVADPEMEFTIVGGDYYPISFRNDYLGRNNSVFDDDGINQALQADLTAFANQWMQNIAIQQNISSI